MAALRALQASEQIRTTDTPSAKSVLFIFLSGGLSQLDSFDMKPNVPLEIRGEFVPIPTRTPGIQVCEHLPKLAELSNTWALVRSVTHWSNEHNEAHTLMLTGRSVLPPGYDPNKPQATDWPSITATVGRLVPARIASLTSVIVVPSG